MSFPLYIGIDTAKLELEVCLGNGRVMTVANTTSGINKLISRLRRESVAWVIIESTGIYSRLACDQLHAAGFKVALVQPGRVKQYARSQGQYAKTDRIDAAIIARYGEATTSLIAYEPPTPDHQHVRALVDRRDQVLDERIREENHSEACLDPIICKMITRNITALNKEITKLEKMIKKVIAADPILTAQVQCLETQKGVGWITAIVILVHMPELGNLNRQEAAALAGLAPFNNDSGPRKGKRTIYGGRGRVRKALYMAALSVIVHDPPLKAFYKNLCERGKLKIVALTAVLRKILLRLNSLMKDFLNPVTEPQTPTASV